jgi:hypothetical protein
MRILSESANRSIDQMQQSDILDGVKGFLGSDDNHIGIRESEY